MSLEVLQWGGVIDGDLPLSAVHAVYKGGQPALIAAAGVDLALAPADYIGFFKNDSVDDDKQGPQVGDTIVGVPGTACSVVIGANKLRIWQAAAGDVFAFPPTVGGAWVPGQEVIITGAGKLDNAAAGTTGGVGRVLVAPASATADLHIQQYVTQKK